MTKPISSGERLNTIFRGDSLEVLRGFPAESIDCCITSPPYWGLRDYGVEGQLGLEKTPEEYVAKMVQVFGEVKRVLKKEGTLWLNLGDSYWANRAENGQSYDDNEVQRKRSGGKNHNLIKPKDLVGIPWRVAFALQADGWWLRQDIIWAKPNPMPESVTDRCTKSHEYVFLLAKSPKYYFDNEAIKEKATLESLQRLERGVSDHHKNINGAPGQTPHSMNMPRINRRRPNGVSAEEGKRNQDGTNGHIGDNGFRNKRSVWTITTKPFKEAHFATFPEDLIVPMVLAGCPKGGTVLDPFIGSGTTGLVAKKLGRNYLGIELNPKYIEIAEKRIGNYNPLL